MYGFDFDPELPAGYQDADLETLELEEHARELEHQLEPQGRFIDTTDPNGPIARMRADFAATAPPPFKGDDDPPPTLELDTGQIALRADVVERNGQQVFEELARPAQPAPLTFERDATEELARRQLEELTRESHERVAPWSPEELETLRRAQEPEPDDPDPLTLTIDGTPVERLTDAGPEILEPAAELRAELEKHTPEELERIAAAPGAMPAARKIAAELVTIADHGKTLEAGGHTFTVEVPAPARARAQAKTPRAYSCACCGRELEPDHYVYSRHTRARFCWPGEGCQSPQEG